MKASPPEPKTEQLELVHVEGQEVWVRSFSGFAKEKDIIDHAFDFMDQLRCALSHLSTSLAA